MCTHDNIEFLVTDMGEDEEDGIYLRMYPIRICMSCFCCSQVYWVDSIDSFIHDIDAFINIVPSPIVGGKRVILGNWRYVEYYHRQFTKQCSLNYK